MENKVDNKLKKVGTREEVYNNLASRTAGNLTKNDIIEKPIGSRKIYISKKLSEKMINNPIFLKRVHKRTLIATPNQAPTQAPNQAPTHSTPTQSTPNHIKKQTSTKTQKLSFKIGENAVKTIYYPELNGVNLKKLKEELLKEEAEEDLGIVIPKKNISSSGASSNAGEFIIEELPEIDINELELC